MVEQAERLLFQVAHEERAVDFREIGEILHDEIDKLEALASGTSDITGTPSGFRDLDDKTGGFQPGNLIVIAARPAMGKSTLVCDFAQNVAMKHHKPVALFSLEMSEMELAHRFIGSQSRISSRPAAQGQGRAEGLAEGRQGLQPARVRAALDRRLLRPRPARAARQGQAPARSGEGPRPRGLGMVIVDYMQLMRRDDARANRVEQVSQFSRGLKILARELAVPVIGISQLSRAPEQRPDKRPILSDLRESGAIEQDADVVGFLYRDDYYNQDSEDPGGAELILAKHRNGPVGHRPARLPGALSEVRRPGARGAAASSSPPARARRSRTRQRGRPLADAEEPELAIHSPTERARALPPRHLRRIRLDPRPRGRRSPLRVPLADGRDGAGCAASTR